MREEGTLSARRLYKPPLFPSTTTLDHSSTSLSLQHSSPPVLQSLTVVDIVDPKSPISSTPYQSSPFKTFKMQFTNIIAVLAVAMTAVAAPTEVVVRNGGGSGGSETTTTNTCNGGSTVACCTPVGGLLGLNVLNCLVGVLTCNGGSAQCCKTSASVSSCLRLPFRRPLD